MLYNGIDKDMASTRIRPTNIVLDRTKSELRVSWSDGHESAYALEYLRANCPCAECKTLRANCPCAECKTLRENPDPLKVLPAFDTSVLAMDLVGNYALQIIWGDGHKYGIYSWDLLRDLG